MIDLPQPTGSDLWPPDEPSELPPLHRPWRTFVAVGEVVLAAVAIWLVFVCWRHGVIGVSETLSDGTELLSHRLFGDWIAGAIGLGVLAVALLVDAVRELLLGIRARHRTPK